ncbi:MAG: glycosyltransferase, partial [Chitinophagales bacterium]|nr:glycosyltransferase [Chitinophagales bacterium]
PNYPNKISDEKIQLITVKTESKQIAKYLKEAYAFIFPSTHESFGMPLLEAMACGVPVITSNSTACKEITKDAAILVDSNSTEEIKIAMQLLMNDKTLHDSLSKKSLDVASTYSWEKAGFLHTEIFKRYAKQ